MLGHGKKIYTEGLFAGGGFAIFKYGIVLPVPDVGIVPDGFKVSMLFFRLQAGFIIVHFGHGIFMAGAGTGGN